MATARAPVFPHECAETSFSVDDEVLPLPLPPDSWKQHAISSHVSACAIHMRFDNAWPSRRRLVACPVARKALLLLWTKKAAHAPTQIDQETKDCQGLSNDLFPFEMELELKRIDAATAEAFNQPA